MPDQSGGAILHSDGGVWVNGYEAHDSSAVFPGDIIETKPGASANLVLDGSTLLLAPESVAKFQADLLELDHGVVSVVTSKGFQVKVNCLRVVPVATDWTQYIVTDLSGSVQVSAKKKDVNVEHQQPGGQLVPEAKAPAPESAVVHEGEQKSYEESEICGNSKRPASPLEGISPKWIIAGGAGGGVLILCLVLHCFGGGGTKPEVSPSTP